MDTSTSLGVTYLVNGKSYNNATHEDQGNGNKTPTLGFSSNTRDQTFEANNRMSKPPSRTGRVCRCA